MQDLAKFVILERLDKQMNVVIHDYISMQVISLPVKIKQSFSNQ